jgi:acetoin utilization deacetylase AcuC-like enzyme
MNTVAFVYHPDYLLHAPPFEHPESPERLVAVIEHLAARGLLGKMVAVTPVYADEADIALVHDPEYLRRLETGCRRRSDAGRRTRT